MDQQSKTGVPSMTWRKVGHAIALAFKTIVHTVVVDVLAGALLWVARTIAVGIPRELKRHRRRWRLTKLSYRFYIVGQVTFLSGVILQTTMKGASWPTAILFVGAGMFLFGFATRVQPIVYRVIDSPSGQLAYRVAQGFFAIIAIVVARAIVYDALKFPPQYFDITVGLVALLAYVPVWIAAIAVLLVIVVSCIYIFWGAAQVAQAVANAVVIPFLGFPTWFIRVQRKVEMRTTKLYFHTVGLIVALGIIGSMFEGFSYVTHQSLRGVRWFAYFADFQSAGKYPGVSCAGRIRLMDNGIVAVARVVDRDIEVSEENFKSEPEPLHGCIAKSSSR